MLHCLAAPARGLTRTAHHNMQKQEVRVTQLAEAHMQLTRNTQLGTHSYEVG